MSHKALEMTGLPSLGARGEGWVALQAIALVAVVAGTFYGSAWSGTPRWAAGAAGAVLLVAGLWLALRAILDLGDSLTALPKPRRRATLIERGVYRRIRHPIYGGVILCCLGWSLGAASFVSLGASAATALVLLLKSVREETWLAERYDGYRAYRTRTWRFLPWL